MKSPGVHHGAKIYVHPTKNMFFWSFVVGFEAVKIDTHPHLGQHRMHSRLLSHQVQRSSALCVMVQDTRKTPPRALSNHGSFVNPHEIPQFQGQDQQYPTTSRYH